MPEIRDLDDLVPEDVEYRYRGKTYTLPGDIDVEHTYRLVKLLGKSGELEAAQFAGETVFEEKPILEARQALDEQVANELLELFQQSDPELAALPFGVTAMRFVLVDVLKALGFEFVPVEDEARPPARSPAKRSGQSKSSRRSSRSSASRTGK